MAVISFTRRSTGFGFKTGKWTDLRLDLLEDLVTSAPNLFPKLSQSIPSHTFLSVSSERLDMVDQRRYQNGSDNLQLVLVARLQGGTVGKWVMRV